VQCAVIPFGGHADYFSAIGHRLHNTGAASRRRSRRSLSLGARLRSSLSLGARWEHCGGCPGHIQILVGGRCGGSFWGGLVLGAPEPVRVVGVRTGDETGDEIF
jgi:hypothetical protein